MRYENKLDEYERSEYVVASSRKKEIVDWHHKNAIFYLFLLSHHRRHLRRQNKQTKKFPSVCLSVCLSVWMYVRTWTFHVDTITFEGVSGSKQNLVGVFHVWNVGLVLKFKVISWSWSWSWSWFWTEFWFSQKLCGATPNFLDIFSIWRITFSNEFHSKILILILKKKIIYYTIQKSITKWYPDPDRNLTESKNWLKLIDWKEFKSVISFL